MARCLNNLASQFASEQKANTYSVIRKKRPRGITPLLSAHSSGAKKKKFYLLYFKD